MKSPGHGKILKILAEENEITAPGFPVVVFGDIRNNWVVKVNVCDHEVVAIQPGDSASLHFDAFPDMKFPGRVKVISGMADPYTGMYEIEIEVTRLNNPKFRAGFIAGAEIFSSKKKMTGIPIDAVFNLSGKKGFVYVVENEKAIKKKLWLPM
ncbi:MAG: HlyD family efflux transporter periplasmic adaptor subunit [Bacteroidales bacterium]|nr:HlyD family efflux transporter periplasmic adaptor subunit [Bacteroidales bacterium]